MTESPIYRCCGGGWLELHHGAHSMAYVHVLPGHLVLRYRAEHFRLSNFGKVE